MSQGTNVCPRCSRPNPMSQIFCSECGAKLDLSSVRSGDFAKKPGVAIGHILWVTFRFLFQAGLVAVLALMLWPATPSGARGGREQAEEARGKIDLLSSAVNNDLKRLIVLNEAEVNACLSELGKSRRPRDKEDRARRRRKPAQLPVDVANMNFHEDLITVLIVAQLGPLALSYEVSGVPSADGTAFSFDVVGARVGHLPLPGVLAAPITHKVKGVFAPLMEERALLDRVDRMAAGEGAVKLGVLPRTTEPELGEGQ